MRSIRESARVDLDGSGNGTVRLPIPRVGYSWLVERVSIEVTGGATSNNPGTSTAKLYLGGEFRDGSETPWLDISEYSGGSLRVHPGVQMTVVFAGCGASQVASVIVEGREVRTSGL